MIDAALAAARAVHFAAVLMVEGTVVFRFGVIACSSGPPQKNAALRSWMRWIVATGWGLAVLSAAAWLFALGAQVDGQGALAALRDGTDWALLTKTQFGTVWMWRAGMAVALAVALLGAERRGSSAQVSAAAAIGLGIALSGSLAWSGHGAATLGSIGDLHLAADILHLIASGVWLGCLLPFAIVLREAMRGSLAMAQAAELTHRFSNLATLSVTVLVLSGIVNGWSLVGSISGLTDTLYGRLLLAKIAVFLVMLAFAAVNRIGVSPRLVRAPDHAHRAASRLVVHTICELALGAAILAIVGVLGTLPPAAHGNHMPESRMQD